MLTNTESVGFQQPPGQCDSKHSNEINCKYLFILVFMLYKRFLVILLLHCLNVSYTVSSGTSFLVFSHWTIQNATCAYWNQDGSSIAQYTTLSILLYPRKGVHAIRFLE